MSRDDQSVAHRMDHVQRVLINALEIARQYPEVDLDLLRVAALLHDVCQPYDRKEEHVELSVEAARVILQQTGYPRDRAEKVLRIISEHSTEKPAGALTSLEAKILFDADKLDGLGATGICRVFALFGQQGRTPLEAVPWYLHKMEIARDKMQTPEGMKKAANEAKYVLDFLCKIREENERSVHR